MNIEKAIRLASEAHEFQVDKADQPYILHPLRVMMAVPAGDAQIVAVLHDIVEDTYVELTDLIAWGYSRAVVDAIEAITHLKSETNFEYYAKVKQNTLATIVKLADIADNAGRIEALTDPDLRNRLRNKYTTAVTALNN